MKYPRYLAMCEKKQSPPSIWEKTNHVELHMYPRKKQTPKNHLDRPLLKIQISDSKETIMVWYKNRNVQLPRLKNDSLQTSYILVTKSHHITANPLLQPPDHLPKLFQQHLEWKRPLTLGLNLIFFSSEIRVLFFHFSLLQSEIKVS